MTHQWQRGVQFCELHVVVCPAMLAHRRDQAASCHTDTRSLGPGIGAAVGIGFTLHEEYAYAGSAVGLLRMITLGMHTVLGIVMARYLGMARYQSRIGRSDAAKRIVLAFVLPVLIHTAYDTLTVANPALQGLGTEMDETSMLLYLVAGIAAIAVCAVWQVIVFVKLKKHAAEYSAMKTAR